MQNDRHINVIWCADHTALQPWTPCLPIRGGKLKTSKNQSNSNPHLSTFVCPPQAFSPSKRSNASTNSLNTSFIWREASPNNFNLYSSSVSSLNASMYRYSLGGHTGSPEWRAMSEEKANNRKTYAKYKTPSQYENMSMFSSAAVSAGVPLLSGRRNKPPVKITKASSIEGRRYSRSTSRERYDGMGEISGYRNNDHMQHGLYDKRINRSFDTPPRQSLTHAPSALRRSTPHLVSEAVYQEHSDEAAGTHAHRNSATWCCGKFMSKQWKKLNNYDWDLTDRPRPIHIWTILFHTFLLYSKRYTSNLLNTRNHRFPRGWDGTKKIRMKHWLKNKIIQWYSR